MRETYFVDVGAKALLTATITAIRAAENIIFLGDNEGNNSSDDTNYLKQRYKIPGYIRLGQLSVRSTQEYGMHLLVVALFWWINSTYGYNLWSTPRFSKSGTSLLKSYSENSKNDDSNGYYLHVYCIICLDIYGFYFAVLAVGIILISNPF